MRVQGEADSRKNEAEKSRATLPLTLLNAVFILRTSYYSAVRIKFILQCTMHKSQLQGTVHEDQNTTMYILPNFFRQT